MTLRINAAEGPAHSRDELTANLAAEIDEMVSAGASEIQLDAPSEVVAVITLDASGKAAVTRARELAD